MTETTDETDDTERNWEALRAQADKAKDLEAQLAKLNRKDAFRDAGLDPTNKLHAALINGYDDKNDGTIREYVDGLGVLTAKPDPGPSQEEQGQTDAARGALGRIGEASQGATTATSNPQSELDDLTRQATTEGWTTDQYHNAMMTWAQKNGVPTTFDGV